MGWLGTLYRVRPGKAGGLRVALTSRRLRGCFGPASSGLLRSLRGKLFHLGSGDIENDLSSASVGVGNRELCRICLVYLRAAEVRDENRFTGHRYLRRLGRDNHNR